METNLIATSEDSTVYTLLARDAGPDTTREARLEIAACYQHVYGTDSAWNEGWICRNCSTASRVKKWNLLERPVACKDCGKQPEEFYPPLALAEKIKERFDWPGWTCIIARQDTKIVGASWGFALTLEEIDLVINNESDETARFDSVAAILKQRYPDHARFGYQSELFVHPSVRGTGVGKTLVRLRRKEMIAHGLDICILQTKTNPPSSVYRWYARDPTYEVIAQRADADGCVVMIGDHRPRSS